MTAIRQNFSGLTVPPPPFDTETRFERCVFNQPEPDMTDPDNPVGIRLWPGDDTPRRFDQCRLINCQVPPNSEVDPRSKMFIMRQVLDTDTVTIDGLVLSVEYVTRIVYGRYRPDGTLVRFPEPQEHRRRPYDPGVAP